METASAIAYAVVIRWMWMLTVFLIYVYGLGRMVVFSTVYLVLCVLSLVFFDYHLAVFGFMILYGQGDPTPDPTPTLTFTLTPTLYGQGVVLLSCIWQYTWLEMTADELNYWESLVRVRASVRQPRDRRGASRLGLRLV